ncbi:hypothetical protein POM88_011348 [Heracleum sosnowskyi]|uniref:Uncharacterized protein n=1 Tax=Heracleum sosnowskyi TaxID=360622 RepID=A0AAD8IXR9_9APIA|nr:hypothetical protein POM88_011348 [Heracleum sosnowskyi]
MHKIHSFAAFSTRLQLREDFLLQNATASPGTKICCLLEPNFVRACQYSTKDETFFDSNVWLDSDCDDDFMSVNGEFTPSRDLNHLQHIRNIGYLISLKRACERLPFILNYLY